MSAFFVPIPVDLDRAILPRPRDHFLRKCARIAHATGESLAEYESAWAGRAEQEWWRVAYPEGREPQFSAAEIRNAYATEEAHVSNVIKLQRAIEHAAIKLGEEPFEGRFLSGDDLAGRPRPFCAPSRSVRAAGRSSSSCTTPAQSAPRST